MSTPKSNILYTSLDEIKSFKPCPSRWKTILAEQNKTESDSVLFPLVDCVKTNTYNDVCWLLGKRKTEINICVVFAKKCADSVAHLKNKEAAAYAAAAAATYAAAAADAIYAIYAIYADVANAAAASAYAANAATYAAYAANAADAADAYIKQHELNKQFLIKAINEYQESR